MCAPARPGPGRRRRNVALGAFGLACTGTVGLLLGYGGAPAAGQERAAAATVVTVIAGSPTEFAFQLSKASNLPWQAQIRSSTITFKVRNRGKIVHRFKVCSAPVKSPKLNTCNGMSTKLLQPGQSATIKVTFTKRGRYEYLSSVIGQAARGMKGLIGIGVALPQTTTAKTTTTSRAATTTGPATTVAPPVTASPPTTTQPPPAPGSTSAGAAVWASAGCGGCHVQSELRGNVGPDLNASHPAPFNNGPLTAQQISDLIAYLDAS